MNYPLADLIARAMLMNRVVRFPAPRRIKFSLSSEVLNKTEECARRAAQQVMCARKGKKWWGPPKWQGSFEATFGGKR
jgi:hypothetical protein